MNRTFGRKRSLPVKTHVRRSVAVPEGRALRVAVVADTHSRPHPNLPKVLEALRPDLVVHAGDIGDLVVLDRLAEHAEVVAVRGNIDEKAPDLPDVITLSVCDGETTLLKILVVHIAVNGPRLRADIIRLAKAEDASLVFCGHSHVPFASNEGTIAVFNPGSVGPRRFELPIVVGLATIARTGVSLSHVDAETGAPWSPAMLAPRVY